MVHVNLTITGEIDEVVQIIRSLAPQGPVLITPPVVEPPPAPTPEPEPMLPPAVSAPISRVPAATPETGNETTAGWTVDNAAFLINGVTGDAATVLLYLARRNPPEATPEQIRSDLRFEPRQLTSALISVGNRASRNGLPTPAVIKRGDTLRIHTSLAHSLTTGETETDHTGAPQSQRNAEWFDAYRQPVTPHPSTPHHKE